MPDRRSLLSQRSIKKWIFRRGTSLTFFAASLVVALIGTGIGLACFFILRTSETAMFQKDLRHGCDFRASILEDTFNTTIIQLGRYFSAFILTQDNLTEPIFANFAQLTSSSSVPIFGAGFASLITSTQRAEWQNRFQRNLTYIGPSFELLPIGPEERDHFPMGLFYSSRPANLIGLDYFATPERAAPARKALETGKPAISDVIPLTLSRNPGFMMFYPVFNYTFDRNFTQKGAVTFAFELSKVIDSNFGNTLPSKIGLEILASNSSYPSQKEVIWHSTLSNVHYIDSEMINVELPVFDRVWQLNCFPSNEFFKTYISWWPAISLILIQVLFIVFAVAVFRSCIRFRATERKILEQAIKLEESMHGYDSIVKYAKTVVCLIPDPMILLDSEGAVIGSNEHACKATSYKPEDFRTKKLQIRNVILEVSDGDEPTLASNATQSLLKTGRRQIIVRRKDGTTFRADASVSTVMSPLRLGLHFDLERNADFSEVELDEESRNSVAQVIIFHDITERIEHLRIMSENKEELRKIGDERQEMLLWLCHELRNPLHIIHSTLEMMKSFKESLRSEALVLLRSSFVASEYMTTAVDDILEYMDVKIKRLFWTQAHNVSMPVVIQKVKDHSSSMVDLKETKLNLTTEMEASLVFNSAKSLNDFTYLLLKAVEFCLLVTPNQSSIDVAIETVENCQNGTVEFRIVAFTDAVLPSDIEKSKMFSFDHVSKGKTFGSPGLGIAIVKKLSNQLQGSVRFGDLDRSDGRRCFVEVTGLVEMSKLKKLEEPGINQRHVRSSSGASVSCASRKKILIAEDNPIVQMMTKKMVEKCGYSYMTVNDGREAVNAVRRIYEEDKEQLGLILMDLIMPNLSGLEAAELIRNELHISPAELPIFAVTANTIENERKKCIDSGLFNGFVPKPLSIGVLKNVLHTWTERGQKETIGK